MINIWEEKYRPKKLKDVVFSSFAEKAYFESIIKRDIIPNMLFCGVQGTGKTTLSTVLINELGIHKNDVLKINCSDEKIDAIRDKVKGFAYTLAEGKFKVVQLEELDYISLEAQALLRSLIESVLGNCVFIATANYPNKIMPAIRSRLEEHYFSSPIMQNVLLRLAEILEQEKVDFDIDTLELVAAAGYPDIRKCIKLIQSCSSSGKLVIRKTENVSDWKLNLLPAIQAGNFAEARKLVVASSSKEELLDIFTFLFKTVDKIDKFAKDINKLEDAILVISHFHENAQFVSDMELHVAAMFIKLGRI